MNRRLLSVLAALVAGLAMAAAADAANANALGSHRVASVVVAGAFGAVVAALAAFIAQRPRERALVAAGALLAALATFVLVRSDVGWLDLGPFGAGTPTQLPLVVAPFVAVLVALATSPRD